MKHPKLQGAVAVSVALAIAISFRTVLGAQRVPTHGDLAGPVNIPLVSLGLIVLVLLGWTGLTWMPRRVQ